jgi:hypothetical protein
METRCRRRRDDYGACALGGPGAVDRAVENARAKERQGTYLSPQDRENLHRYGGNDDYGPRYSYGPYGYGGGYYADYYGYQPRYRAYPTYPY